MRGLHLLLASLLANAAFWAIAVLLGQGGARLLALSAASLLSLYALVRKGKMNERWRALIISTLATSLLAHLYQAVAFLSFGALGAYLIAIAYGGISVALAALLALSLLLALASGKG